DYFVADEVVHVRIGNEIDASYFARGDRSLRAELMRITRETEARRLRDELELFRRTGEATPDQVPPGLRQDVPPANQDLLRLAGQPHDGVKRHYTGLMDERTPFIASLAEDPRFADVAEELLDKPMLGIATDGNYYVGDTLWHPDIGSHAYEGIKFAIYCDPQD